MSSITFEVVTVSSWTADGERYDAGEDHTIDARSDTARLLAGAVAAEPNHFVIHDGQDALDKLTGKHVEPDEKSLAVQERFDRHRAELDKPGPDGGPSQLDRMREAFAKQEAAIRERHAKRTGAARSAHERDSIAVEEAVELEQARMVFEAERDAIAIPGNVDDGKRG